MQYFFFYTGLVLCSWQIRYVCELPYFMCIAQTQSETCSKASVAVSSLYVPSFCSAEK